MGEGTRTMKVNSGGGHLAKAAHAPKPAPAQAVAKKAAPAEAPKAAAAQPNYQAGLASGGSVGTKFHAVG